MQYANVYFFPAEYNSYGAGASVCLSLKTDENAVWKRHYNITDQLGNTRLVLREDAADPRGFRILGEYNYEAYGRMRPVLDTDPSQARMRYIGKERDEESLLADHGVRKYDYDLARFTCPDPLWEKYYSWTPYQYAGCNPVTSLDPTGYAIYFDENGRELDDKVPDKRRIAVNSKVMDDNTFTKDGNTSYDFNSMEVFGYILPNYEVAEEILVENRWSSSHQSRRIETGGVGNAEKYIHGGEGSMPNNASDAVLKAYNSARKDGIVLLYYVHKHPDGNLNPSDDFDDVAIKELNIDYGILVGIGKVKLFRSESEEIEISNEQFKGQKK